MKLLASLLGCAAADWACCGYDEFGIVNPDCPLTEKTPWAMKTDNAETDPEGITDHHCKSWEANIDATMEGNDNKDNWGGCGFQRHFPWAMRKTTDGEDKSGAGEMDDDIHCNLGVFDCSDTSNVVSVYGALKTSAGFLFSLTNGAFSASGTNAVFGEVHLGGVCKLWIPVTESAIDSVHIAGVHMNGGGTVGDGGTMAVFDGAELCHDETCSDATKTVAGTAYCFSVVNIGEFMRNNNEGGPHDVMNANVAGKDDGGHPSFDLAGTASEGAYTVHYGDSIRPGALNGGGDTAVNVGASFDVVVHFKSQWCISHWTIVDMQAPGDWNSETTADDYVLEGNPPHHHHTDVADKRFDGQVGVCGCCADGGDRHDTVSTITAKGCFACSGCSEFNTYGAMVGTQYSWPNAGAWAAFYSFITCADNGFMIYDVATAAGTGTITKTSNMRQTVHSMFYNDVRHDWTNAHEGSGTLVIRGNMRQVGTMVTNCGPGIIHTDDSARCTWNWNFVVNTAGDAEDWFERDDPKEHRVWLAGDDTDRNVETSVFDGLITSLVETHDFSVVFQNDDDLGTNVDDSDDVFTLDASKYFTTPAKSVTAANHEFSFTMHCKQSNVDGTGIEIDGTGFANAGDTTDTNIRDLFPDCYFGDEIHFQYTLAKTNSVNNDQRLNAWYSYTTYSF